VVRGVGPWLAVLRLASNYSTLRGAV
jgi:hypothetical protein